MKKIMSFVILTLLSIITTAQIKTVPVNNAELQIKNNTILYALPRAIVHINIKVETEYFIPGPYNRFADKYLSIKNAQSERTTSSEIREVNINIGYEADPDAFYLVFDKKNNFNISLNNAGIISSFKTCRNSNDFINLTATTQSPSYYNELVEFTDLSNIKNFIDITDTTYKVVEIDSIFQKIPVYNTKITSKSLEQKAEEAANFILTIRNRKFDQMSGFFDIEYPSIDLQIMLDEMKNLEMQYLELFIGRKTKVVNEFSYTYIPKANQKNETVELFYLSDSQGILLKKDADSKPVILQIDSNSTTLEIDRFFNRQTELKDKVKGLYYRIPGQASLKIVHDSHTYIEKIQLIPQYGYTNYLPAKMFKNKKLNIIFDEKMGSVITITNE